MVCLQRWTQAELVRVDVIIMPKVGAGSEGPWQPSEARVRAVSQVLARMSKEPPANGFFLAQVSSLHLEIQHILKQGVFRAVLLSSVIF